MCKDIVWDEAAAEQIRTECERSMIRQACDLRNTVDTYYRIAKNLDQQAKEQEHIAITAMTQSQWTDQEGVTHSMTIPDTAVRAQAIAKIAEYRKQTEILRTAAERLITEISDLDEAIFSVNAHFRQLQNRVQNTDLEYAHMLFQARDDIVEYTNNMKAIYECCDEPFMTMPAIDATSLTAGSQTLSTIPGL